MKGGRTIVRAIMLARVVITGMAMRAMVRTMAVVMMTSWRMWTLVLWRGSKKGLSKNVLSLSMMESSCWSGDCSVMLTL